MLIKLIKFEWNERVGIDLIFLRPIPFRNVPKLTFEIVVRYD